jgi:putative component of toxin-antitoxin plasmid stabilization module
MRMEATEIYRDWIDGLKDLVGRARIQACRATCFR